MWASELGNPLRAMRPGAIGLALVLALPATLATGGCAVVSVVGATAGAAISVTGAVVGTGVKVTGKVIGKTIDVLTPGSDPAP